MTDAEKIAQLEEKLDKLQAVVDALLRERWHERGVMKGVATNLDSIRGKVEAELQPFFNNMLERRKSEIPIKP